MTISSSVSATVGSQRNPRLKRRALYPASVVSSVGLIEPTSSVKVVSGSCIAIDVADFSMLASTRPVPSAVSWLPATVTAAPFIGFAARSSTLMRTFSGVLLMLNGCLAPVGLFAVAAALTSGMVSTSPGWSTWGSGRCCWRSALPGSFHTTV